MTNMLFTFVPPSPTSKATGHTIARFIAKTLDLPMGWNKEHLDQDYDVLLLMPGSSAFCNCREELAEKIITARRIVWIQDDYTQRPPAVDSKAESAYRAAFRIRHEKGLAPVDYWSTVERNTALTDGSHYVNWNCLGYEPMKPLSKYAKDLFYYGVWRPGREKFFDRVFSDPQVKTTISSKPGNEFERYTKCEHVKIMSRPELIPELQRHGFGLCLEDDNSHRMFNSPPRRFYEMLSAGLPMLFQPESVAMFDKAGYDIRPFLIENSHDVKKFMKKRDDMAFEQSRWRRSHVAITRAQLKKAAAKVFK